MKLLITIAALFISNSVFAQSNEEEFPRRHVDPIYFNHTNLQSVGSVERVGDRLNITLSGPHSEDLYNSLDVEPEFIFSAARRWVKTTNTIICQKVGMGDRRIPGKKYFPTYSCTILGAVR